MPDSFSFACIIGSIYECSLLCKCNRRMCQNRVVQHGPQVRLQVFKTEKKGWGVRCLDDIDKGTFVCIYSGKAQVYFQITVLQLRSTFLNLHLTSQGHWDLRARRRATVHREASEEGAWLGSAVLTGWDAQKVPDRGSRKEKPRDKTGYCVRHIVLFFSLHGYRSFG